MATRASAPPSVNPLRTRADWDRARQQCLDDPGAFHGAVAAREVHWFDPTLGAWITWDDAAQAWTGYDAQSGAPVQPPYGADHTPWTRAFDADDAPFYRWFSGGLTNAAFNEIDRHILAGHGDETASSLKATGGISPATATAAAPSRHTPSRASSCSGKRPKPPSPSNRSAFAAATGSRSTCPTSRSRSITRRRPSDSA